MDVCDFTVISIPMISFFSLYAPVTSLLVNSLFNYLFFFFYWQWLHHSISSVSHSVVSDSAPSWTVAHQPPLSMEFSRQEYCSGLPSLSPRDLFDPRTEPTSLAMQADFLPSEPSGLYYRRHKIIQGPVHEFSNKNAVTNHLQTLKEGR